MLATDTCFFSLACCIFPFRFHSFNYVALIAWSSLQCECIAIYITREFSVRCLSTPFTLLHFYWGSFSKTESIIPNQAKTLLAYGFPYVRTTSKQALRKRNSNPVNGSIDFYRQSYVVGHSDMVRVSCDQFFSLALFSIHLNLFSVDISLIWLFSYLTFVGTIRFIHENLFSIYVLANMKQSTLCLQLFDVFSHL